MQETTRKFGINKKIEFQHKVLAADWSSDQQHWRLEVVHDGETKIHSDTNAVGYNISIAFDERPMDQSHDVARHIPIPA